MAVYSSDLSGIFPDQIVDGIVEKTKTTGTIAALSNQEPMRFGDVTIVTFDDDLTAEFVEQSAAKSEDIAPLRPVTAVPHKAVVNFRTSNEFLIADEDYQLGILDEVRGQVRPRSRSRSGPRRLLPASTRAPAPRSRRGRTTSTPPPTASRSAPPRRLT